MLAYRLKEILTLLPEALPMVKKADIDQDLPLGNRDSCIATALSLKYSEVVSHQPVDVFSLEKVAAAVKLYGVEQEVSELSAKLVKAASDKRLQDSRNVKEEYLLKQAYFEGENTGFPDPVHLSEQAGELFKEAKQIGLEPSERVIRYSGNAFLSKKAAVESLAARFQATKNTDFAKIATAIGRLDTDTLKAQTVQDICSTVAQLDKEAGLNARGFDFYREALMTKEAAINSALNVKLCGKPIAYEKIAAVGRDRISHYVGEDVAKEMDKGAAHSKQVFETLPLDLQRVIVDLTKNV